MVSFLCVLLCLRSLGRFERCDRNSTHYFKTSESQFNLTWCSLGFGWIESLLPEQTIRSHDDCGCGDENQRDCVGDVILTVDPNPSRQAVQLRTPLALGSLDKGLHLDVEQGHIAN